MPQSSAVRPTLGQLFVSSFTLGLLSFGGGLAGWMHREFVVRRNWLSEKDFQTDLAVARLLPGTNVSNFLVIGGYRMGGLAGSVTALVALLAPPFAIILALAQVYDVLNGPLLQSALQGTAAAALGLLAPLVTRGIRHVGLHWTAVTPLAAIAAAVGLFGVSMPLALLVAIPCSVAMTIWRRRRDA